VSALILPTEIYHGDERNQNSKTLKIKFKTFTTEARRQREDQNQTSPQRTRRKNRGHQELPENIEAKKSRRKLSQAKIFRHNRAEEKAGGQKLEILCVLFSSAFKGLCEMASSR
jgi:hypothetical protein